MIQRINIEYKKDIKLEYKIIDLLSKSVKGIVIPKKYINDIKKIEEFKNENSIYFLIKEAKRRVSLEYMINEGNETEEEINEIYNSLYIHNIPLLYIGETTRTATRYNYHHFNDGDWDYAIIIISKFKNQFTENQILYMEKYYYEKYKDSIYCNLTMNNPQGKLLNDNEKFEINKTISDINELLYLVDKEIFNLKFNLYKIKSKGIAAYGYILEEIDDKLVVVKKGSEVVKNTTYSANKTLINKREKLRDNKIIQLKGNKYIFTKDYIFKSRSGAAECILGNNRNGYEIWKPVEF